MIYHYHLKNEKYLIKIKLNKTFYKYVNNKLHAARHIAPTCDNKGNLNYDDKTHANLFNKFFGSVFFNDNGNTPVFHFRLNSSIYPNNINFSPERVCSIINNLKSNSAAGPDGLPACFFRKLRHSLSVPLNIIFSLSYDTGCLPDDWQHAIVCSIFKKDNASKCENYRPTSLTYISRKIMETIINEI